MALYNFCSIAGCTDGDGPYGGLALGPGNNPFYGTTLLGGANGDGTVFSVTIAGGFTLLHSFHVADGDLPYDGLVWAPTKKMFYGTTSEGGTICCGTVFKMTTAGVLTTVHNFAGPTADGSFSYSGLALGPAGNSFLYGTTSLGGANSDGTTYDAK